MKHNKKMVLLKPWVCPAVTPQEQARRDAMYAQLERLGIDVFSFDSEEPQKGSIAGFDFDQIEKDKSLAWALIMVGKEVPQDVQERLLKVKAERERLTGASDH